MTLMQHQREALTRMADAPGFALLFEQGTGKTRTLIEDAEAQYARGRINCVIVAAPNGVHLNWARNELPKWARVPHTVTIWRDGKPRGDDPMDTGPHLRWVLMNIESWSTEKGRAYAERIARASTAMLVVDESHTCKTPGVARTKTALALAKLCPIRRILTGTAIAQSPFDAYAQFKLLDPWVWQGAAFAAFKAHYGEFVRRKTSSNRLGYYDELLSYRNLDELAATIAPLSMRVRKEDVLDLPPKVYRTRPVILSDEQRRIYRALRDDGIAALGMGGATDDDLFALLTDPEADAVTAANALTLVMRLAQVTGGWVRDDAGNIRQVGTAKLDALLEEAQEIDGQGIVWCRFRAEAEACAAALDAVLLHGGVPTEQRMDNVARFQSGDVKWLVATQATGGTGLTLTAASSVLYFSNDFKAVLRLQSEDRSHRIGQARSVCYTDLIAEDTVDEIILRALRENAEIADNVYNAMRRTA